MVAKYVSAGMTIDITAEKDIAVGDVVIVEELVGVAVRDIAKDAAGALAISGIYEFPTDATEIKQGKPVYWDKAQSKVVTTAESNKYIGKVAKTSAEGATVVAVILNAPYVADTQASEAA